MLDAARDRIALAFNNFEKVCVSFSGGKDSTVMLHMVMEEARRRDRKVGLLFIDLEAQYKYTIELVEKCFVMYKDLIDPYWVSLPLHLRNAVSTYEPFWKCWDREAEKSWVRRPNTRWSITDYGKFPFFQEGMEFEEFVPFFAEWYSNGVPTAFFVGIRCDESLNRFRAIVCPKNDMFLRMHYTTGVGTDSYNFYPIYDWTTEDVWSFCGKNRELPYNRLYDAMHKAGVPLSHQRICQPYGDDQRRGLWLYHLIEPETWGLVVARVNGANSGALYSREYGNINGYRRVSKPDHLTWKGFAHMLVKSMPVKTGVHFSNKIWIFVQWWMRRGYSDGIPDEADYALEMARKVPSWRRVCKSILRNDYWCKGLGFSQHKSTAYQKYLDLMKRRRSGSTT